MGGINGFGPNPRVVEEVTLQKKLLVFYEALRIGPGEGIEGVPVLRSPLLGLLYRSLAPLFGLDQVLLPIVDDRAERRVSWVHVGSSSPISVAPVLVVSLSSFE